jgi:hypothetical protein
MGGQPIASKEVQAMDTKLSRRDLLNQSAASGALALLGAAACSKEPRPLVCTDTFGLSTADLTVRTTLAYVDNSVEPGKTCQLPAIHSEDGRQCVRHLQGAQGPDQSEGELQVVPRQAGLTAREVSEWRAAEGPRAIGG